jgi:hypothetical protein
MKYRCQIIKNQSSVYKSKVVILPKHRTTEAYSGVEAKFHVFLILAMMEVNGRFHAPASLFRVKVSLLSVDGRVGGLQGQLELVSKTEVLPLLGIKPRSSSP